MKKQVLKTAVRADKEALRQGVATLLRKLEWEVYALDGEEDITLPDLVAKDGDNTYNIYVFADEEEQKTVFDKKTKKAAKKYAKDHDATVKIAYLVTTIVDVKDE